MTMPPPPLRLIRTRKDKRCVKCLKEIPKGSEAYYYSRWIIGGSNYYWHKGCHEEEAAATNTVYEVWAAERKLAQVE